MKDYVDLGPVPSEENPLQVGSNNYTHEKARAECQRHIKLIEKKMGHAPDGARLVVTSCPHSFGSYYTVYCWFDGEKSESIDYAFKCESDGPMTWE